MEFSLFSPLKFFYFFGSLVCSSNSGNLSNTAAMLNHLPDLAGCEKKRSMLLEHLSIHNGNMLLWQHKTLIGSLGIRLPTPAGKIYTVHALHDEKSDKSAVYVEKFGVTMVTSKNVKKCSLTNKFLYLQRV